MEGLGMGKTGREEYGNVRERAVVMEGEMGGKG